MGPAKASRWRQYVAMCSKIYTVPLKTYKHMLLARVWCTGWLLNHAFYGMSVCGERAEASCDSYLHGSGPLRMEAWSREFVGCAQNDAICMVFARSVGDVLSCESVAYAFDRYLHCFSSI